MDGTVVEGHGVMDEAYLTGEPYKISKTPGSAVISGAINGETVMTIRADKRAVDSRYAKIMQVMRDSGFSVRAEGKVLWWKGLRLVRVARGVVTQAAPDAAAPKPPLVPEVWR